MPDLVPSQVALNLHLSTATAAENELDVALVNSRNAFRYAECKTSLESDESGASLLIEILYKQAAIRKNFGLTSSALLVTVDKITKSSSLGRARDLDLKIIDHDILYNEYDLRRELVAHLA